MAPAIPRDLLASAYLSLSGEPAWSKEDAVKVINWATASRLPVSGVEVWLPTTPGPTIPTPYIYTFETEKYVDENRDRFVERANSAAMDYVKSFEWETDDRQHHGLIPFFNITLDDG